MTRITIPGPRKFAGYAYRIRHYISAVSLLMAASFLAGVLASVLLPEATARVIEVIAAEMAGSFSSLSPPMLMVNLFLHNAFACMLEVALGLLFGVITLFIVFDNGLVLGLVLGTYAAKAGLLLTVAMILPHGVVELPAVVLSAAIGLRLGHCTLRAVLRRPVDMIGELSEAASIFLAWVLPLLLIAAFVESFVTAALAFYLTGNGL